MRQITRRLRRQDSRRWLAFSHDPASIFRALDSSPSNPQARTHLVSKGFEVITAVPDRMYSSLGCGRTNWLAFLACMPPLRGVALSAAESGRRADAGPPSGGTCSNGLFPSCDGATAASCFILASICGTSHDFHGFWDNHIQNAETKYIRTFQDVLGANRPHLIAIYPLVYGVKIITDMSRLRQRPRECHLRRRSCLPDGDVLPGGNGCKVLQRLSDVHAQKCQSTSLPCCSKAF